MCSGAGDNPGWSKAEAECSGSAILFLSASVGPGKPAAKWAEDSNKVTQRRCPVCERDSIIGNRHRRNQRPLPAKGG
jgi:hypothetical protein